MTAICQRFIVRLLVTAIVIYIGAMPFYSSLGGSAHDAARLAQIPLFLLSAVTLIINIKRLPDSTGYQQFGLAALAVLAGMSCASATDPGAALRETTLWISLLTLSAAVFVAGVEGWMHLIIRVVVAAWLVYSAFFFLAWTANLLSHGETHFWLMVPGFDNPRFLNHVQTVAIPLLVAATAQASTRRATSALSWIALALCFAMLIGLVARASAISLLAGSLVALLVFGRAARPFIGRIFLGGVLGLLIYILIFQGIPYCLDLKTISSPHTSADLVSDHSRLYLWKIALDNIKTTPFLGVGPMHYAAQINGRGAHPHNIYLQLAAEFGLPFFLLLAVMIAAFVKRTICQIRLTSQAPDIITIATTAALASALVDGAFSGNFVMPMAQTWIYLTAGLFLAKVWRPIAVQPLAQTTNAVGVAVLVGIFSLQIWYSIETIHEYLHKPTTINSRPSLPETEANSPRFWLDGWL